MAISQPRPDILVRNPEGYPIVFVEVKNLKDLSRDEAIELRHNLIEYGVPSNVLYFLLLSQDIGYLWKNSTWENRSAPPDYEFPTHKIVTRYVVRGPNERLYGEELELIVLQWLIDLATGTQETAEEPEKTLAEAGFIRAIREGSVYLREEQ